MEYKYKKAIIGGTFDHLHKGHKYFIEKAFSSAGIVTIGITADEFIKNKKYLKSVQNFEERKEEVIDFLKKKGFQKRAEIIQIKDIYGNSLKEKDIDVIFVDEKGWGNALKINSEREKKGWPEIEIVKNTYVKDDDGKVLSSTSIRKGCINRSGFSYSKQFANKSVLSMPENLRGDLRKPFGKVVKEIKKKDFQNKFVIAVGDIVVSKLVEQNIVPDVSIYDYMTKRIKISKESVLKYLPTPKVFLMNVQGAINAETVKKLSDLIEELQANGEKTAIQIKGEEDLLALPAILMAPLGSLVVYGIRDVGMIMINVDEMTKEKINKYISKFDFRS